MNYKYVLFLLIFTKYNSLYAQETPIELDWKIDTTSFGAMRSLPVGPRGEYMKLPVNTLNGANYTLFSYPIYIQNDRSYLNCYLSANKDSVVLAVDKNLDSIFQDSEIFRFTNDEFVSEDLSINFSILKEPFEETFFTLGSLKKSALKIAIPDSLLSLNPLYLVSKNILRSEFMIGGKSFFVIVQNANTGLGLGHRYKYLITKSLLEESDLIKVGNWADAKDTISIAEGKAIVSSREVNGKIGFHVINSTNLYGTYLGVQMPRLIVSNLDKTILKIPNQQKGKIDLIEFWGTWCAPCIALYPRLSNLLKDNKEMINYVGIPGADAKDKVVNYVQKKADIKQQIFEPDDNKALISLFKIDTYPAFILIDEKGTIVAREYGTDGFENIEKKIKAIKAKELNR